MTVGDGPLVDVSARQNDWAAARRRLAPETVLIHINGVFTDADEVGSALTDRHLLSMMRTVVIRNIKLPNCPIPQLDIGGILADLVWLLRLHDIRPEVWLHAAPFDRRRQVLFKLQLKVLVILS